MHSHTHTPLLRHAGPHRPVHVFANQSPFCGNRDKRVKFFGGFAGNKLFIFAKYRIHPLYFCFHIAAKIYHCADGKDICKHANQFRLDKQALLMLLASPRVWNLYGNALDRNIRILQRCKQLFCKVQKLAIYKVDIILLILLLGFGRKNVRKWFRERRRQCLDTYT